MALGDVSSDPEALRFQYQAVEEGLLQQNPAPSKKRDKAVYREQVRGVKTVTSLPQTDLLIAPLPQTDPLIAPPPN